MEDWAERRRLYAFFIPRSTNVFDLKTKLEHEFGLPYEQTQVYFDNFELEQSVYLTDILDCAVNEDDILTMICTSKP